VRSGQLSLEIFATILPGETRVLAIAADVRAWSSLSRRGRAVISPQEVVREFFAVFSAGDVEQILARLTDDATWWVAGSIPNMSGENSKAALGELLRSATTLYKGRALRITPTSMISAGNVVAVEAEGYAELNDGSVYSNRYHFRIEVRGDRIQGVREYNDTHHMFRTFSPYLSGGT